MQLRGEFQRVFDKVLDAVQKGQRPDYHPRVCDIDITRMCTPIFSDPKRLALSRKETPKCPKKRGKGIHDSQTKDDACANDNQTKDDDCASQNP
eukprot:3955952-Amphidinium_carterae.1